jgi:hypothetical protein
MAVVIFSLVDWFRRATHPDGRQWELWNDFYNRDVAVLEHTNGATYLASAGVNQRTGGWDVVVLRAPGDGRIVVHHYFRQRIDLPDKAASVDITECKPASPLAGKLNVTIGCDYPAARAGEGGLFNPFSFFLEP